MLSGELDENQYYHYLLELERILRHWFSYASLRNSPNTHFDLAREWQYVRDQDPLGSSKSNPQLLVRMV
jgi:hypothetical protein